MPTNNAKRKAGERGDHSTASQNYVPPPIDLGLFWWNTDRSEAEKKAITAWYRGLDPQSRKYVDALRDEVRDEGRDQYDWDFGE